MLTASLFDLPLHLRMLEPDPSLPPDPLLEQWWMEELEQWKASQKVAHASGSPKTLRPSRLR